MSKSTVIVGFGPGISTAVAGKFGAEGFSVALVARSPERLDAGVKALKAKGVKAAAFAADAGEPAATRAAIGKARAEFGPITVILWNVYSGGDVGDLIATDPVAVGGVFDVAVVGLLAAVQEALPDLKSTKDGAVLVTNGAFGETTPMMDALATNLRTVGVALANAAKYKLVGLLSQRLAADGVYVGEVMVAGAVKGTPFASGGQGIEASAIADKFWELYRARDEVRARIT
jgi:NAD(P)-dependent dehydrogenase (short-subunit alcohol dehydrogenase family)